MHVGSIIFILILIWTPCILSDRWDDLEMRRFIEEYIPKLQNNLRRAYKDSDENNVISRTISKNNRHYDMHLIKLRKVNGLKTHNLIVKERSDDNPLIYIINPVETKIPHAFVSETEFKDILNNRGKQLRNEVYTTKDPKPLLPVNATYWIKLTWSKPTLNSVTFPYKNFFKSEQHNTKPVVRTKKTKHYLRLNKNSKLKNNSPHVPHFHYIRTRNGKTKTNKTQHLRNNRTRKGTSYKPHYLTSIKTSNAKRNKATSLKHKTNIKAKIIYLKANSTTKTKKEKILLRNLSAKSLNQTVTDILKLEQNIGLAGKKSTAKIIIKQINETIEKKTTMKMVTEKLITENKLLPLKNEVASTTEVFTTTKKQSSEVVILDISKKSDLTTAKLKAENETKKGPEKTVIENTGDSKSERVTTEGPIDSEITPEKLIIEYKITKEPTNTDSKEEKLLATEKTAETPATDTTKPFDNTENNMESANTEDQNGDLATDQSKFEETTVQRPLPFRTTLVKRTTTKARPRTTRSRLSRPLVFMGETGKGNSWN